MASIIYGTTMLVSTKILCQYSDRTQVVREWRVVQVPEEDARITDISTLSSVLNPHPACFFKLIEKSEKLVIKFVWPYTKNETQTCIWHMAMTHNLVATCPDPVLGRLRLDRTTQSFLRGYGRKSLSCFSEVVVQ